MSLKGMVLTFLGVDLTLMLIGRFAEDAFAGVPVIHALMMEELHPTHLTPFSNPELTREEMGGA
jgi:hypothetical protein